MYLDTQLLDTSLEQESWQHQSQEIGSSTLLYSPRPSTECIFRECVPVSSISTENCAIDGETYSLLQHLISAYKTLPNNSVLLDFAGGTILYPLFGAVPHAREVHFCDSLNKNLNAILKWVRKDKDAFNWQPFVRATLELEHHRPCSTDDILRREEMLRQRLTHITRCDMRLDPPLRGAQQKYDVVISHLNLELTSANRKQWRYYLSVLASLLKPGGAFLISMRKFAKSYAKNRKSLSTQGLKEADLAWGLLTAGCNPKSIVIRSIQGNRTTHPDGGLLFGIAEAC
ncbi:MAG: guanitoxin biosynthesis pre-guanitoxin forming N-methyltransferase GntF [Candidatus Binatia bacterium]